MITQRTRGVAYKVKIGDIFKGEPIIETVEGKERLNFLIFGDKKIQRINIVSNIIDKYTSERERNFSTITIDDASGQIQLKMFGEDVIKFEQFNQGDTVTIIGLLRIYKGELYILPEIIKKVDPRYLLIRKLELERIDENISNTVKKSTQLKDQLIDIIRNSEESGGIDTEEIILKIKANPNVTNAEIIRLIEDGIIYEPRPGRVRFLGN